MNAILVLFYLSLLSMIGMLILRSGKARNFDQAVSVEERPDLSAVGLPLAHKISTAKSLAVNKVKISLFAVAKHSLDWFFKVYKAGGVMLLKAKDKMAKFGREKKLHSPENVSSYIKDVMDHKENLRNGGKADL